MLNFAYIFKAIRKRGNKWHDAKTGRFTFSGRGIVSGTQKRKNLLRAERKGLKTQLKNLRRTIQMGEQLGVSVEVNPELQAKVHQASAQARTVANRLAEIDAALSRKVTTPKAPVPEATHVPLVDKRTGESVGSIPIKNLQLMQRHVKPYQQANRRLTKLLDKLDKLYPEYKARVGNDRWARYYKRESTKLRNLMVHVQQNKKDLTSVAMLQAAGDRMAKLLAQMSLEYTDEGRWQRAYLPTQDRR